MKPYLPYRPYLPFTASGIGAFRSRWSRYYNVDPALGANATFTRAGTAYVQDHLGVYNLALANEARFEGARREENIVLSATTADLRITSTDDLTLGDSDGTVSVSYANGISTLTAVSADAFLAWYRDVNAPLNGSVTKTFQVIASIRGVGASIGKTAGILGSTFSAVRVPKLITLTGEFQRIQLNLGTSFTATLEAWFILSANGANLANGDQIEVKNLEISKKDYANAVPWISQYVRASSANINGVEYFPYANGNTVDANGVVTEAQGAAIDPDTMYLLMEPAATNYVPYSYDLTRWSGSQATLDQVGLTGQSNTATKCVDYADWQTDQYYTTLITIPETTGLISAAFWIKKQPATASFPSVQLNVVGGTQQFFGVQVNIETSAIVVVQNTNVLEQYTTVKSEGNFLKVVLSILSRGNTGAQPVFKPAYGPWGSENVAAMGSVVVANVGVYSGLTHEAVVDMSPILTTSAAVTRAADALAYSGVPADNEALFTNKLGVETVSDDWTGTVAVPSAHRSIEVYNPGERP